MNLTVQAVNALLQVDNLGGRGGHQRAGRSWLSFLNS
jgi:hypothetical protein